MGKSGRRRKRRTHVPEELDPDAPRIIVIRRGSLRPELRQLVKDLRTLLSPNSATRLNEATRQKMKDFTEVGEVLGLTHIIAVSETERQCYLKVANLPNGPTLTFSIDLLTLVSDIAKHTCNPKSVGVTSNYSPLVVLNGFTGAGEPSNRSSVGDKMPTMSTVANIFNRLFSPIDVSTTKMTNCKRVVLFNKERDSDVIVMRHYLINLVDCHTSGAVQGLIDKKSIKRLINENNASFKDLMKGMSNNDGSVLSMQDKYVELNNVDPGDLLLRHKYGLKTTAELEKISEGKGKLAVSLTEAGPRLNLRLIKIQEGVFAGAVKFHKYVNKTKEEIEQLEAHFREKRRLEREEEEKRKKEKVDEEHNDEKEEKEALDEADSD
ncbi:peter pan-related protein [Babesia gibsoni]|uniref:Peter pan-related protein n=1 Tax=Babesia gibsoni TaxID=33632 RepID=A0AAD8PG88_BABGI|nr:peter pan-related protein [Babesia gibsoni]